MVDEDEANKEHGTNQPPSFSTSANGNGSLESTTTHDLQDLHSFADGAADLDGDGAADMEGAGSGHDEDSEIDTGLRPNACKDLTKQQSEDLAPAPKAIQKIVNKKARYAEYLKTSTPSRGSSMSAKRQRAMSGESFNIPLSIYIYLIYFPSSQSASQEA